MAGDVVAGMDAVLPVLEAAAVAAGGSISIGPGHFPGRVTLLVAGLHIFPRELCEVCVVDGQRVVLASYGDWEDGILFAVGMEPDDACFLHGSVSALSRAVAAAVSWLRQVE